MRVGVHLATISLLLVVLPGKACGDTTSDAAQLKDLIAKIDAMLPPGWTLAFEVADDHCRRSRPKLVVSSVDALPTEYVNAIGAAAGVDPSPYIVQEKVKVEISLVPHLAMTEYAMVRDRNVAFQRQRREFEENRLHQRQSRYKGGFTPTTYEQVTGEKSPLLPDYSLLWVNTEPQTLPTHYYGTLSMESFDLHDMSSVTIVIHDAQRDKEYGEILLGLEKLLVPYAKLPE